MKSKNAIKLAAGLLLAGVPAAEAWAQARAVTGTAILPQLPMGGAGGGTSGITVPLSGPQKLPADAKTRIAVVRRVTVDGAYPELAAQTSALIATVEGRRLSLAEAYEFAARVQQAYGAAGYPLVNAVLEPSSFSQGEVRVQIIDGYIENIDLSAVPEDLRGLVRSRLASLIGRKHITRGELQRQILLIGELPGVNGNTTTRPGAQPGAVILAVKANETPFSATTSVNNYLPSYFGTYQFAQGFVLNNALGLGETIHAEATSSDDFDQFFNGRGKAESFGLSGVLPIGADGATVGAGYSQSRTTPTPLPGEFAPPYDSVERIQNIVQRASVRSTYPVFLSLEQTIRAQIGFDFTDNADNGGPYALAITPSGQYLYSVFHDQYETLRLAGEWKVNFPWDWGGNAISALIFSQGLGGLNGSLTEPLSRPGASPEFSKLRAEVRIIQPLPESFVFAVLGRAQTSFGHSLMLPEELVLDGPDALSGFGLGSLYVDSGAVGRAEFQRPFAIPLGTSNAIAVPYIFGAVGGGRYEQVFAGQNPNVQATSFGGGVRTNGNFTGWPFNETLNFELARVNSNVPYAREGYAATFAYSMKYSDNPFAGARPGLIRLPERRTADFSSSGFYAGLNAGYAFGGNSNIASTGRVVDHSLDDTFGGNAAAVSAANVTRSAPGSANSGVSGGQIGYNYAYDRFVFGGEADFQGLGQAGLSSQTRVANASFAGATETAATTITGSKSVDWLGTVRGRLGVTASPNLLGYVTGGLAYGGVAANTRALQNWTGAGLGPLAAEASSSNTYGDVFGSLVGWTVGGGLEWMFAPGLSLKGEVLYYDLGSKQYSAGGLNTTIAGAPYLFGANNTIAMNSSTRFDGYVLRAGLNYHFGLDEPASSDAPTHVVKGPIESSKPVWNGLYAGLNSGYTWGVGSMAANGAHVGLTDLDRQLGTSLAVTSAEGIPGQSKTAPSGAIGGGQVGYNMQLSRGMIGVEADLQGAGAKNRGAYATLGREPLTRATLLTEVDNAAAIDWLGTVRGRLGFFATPSLLAFGTGGLAYGETTSATFVNQEWRQARSPFSDLLKTSGSIGIADKFMTGWTIGAGFEWMFSRNLSLKGEYLYYDLGVANYASSPAYTSFGKSNSVIPTTSVHYDGQLVRLGLNYHFDYLSAPILVTGGE
jgi:hemolysin activation/secretion protein